MSDTIRALAQFTAEAVAQAASDFSFEADEHSVLKVDVPASGGGSVVIAWSQIGLTTVYGYVVMASQDILVNAARGRLVALVSGSADIATGATLTLSGVLASTTTGVKIVAWGT